MSKRSFESKGLATAAVSLAILGSVPELAQASTRKILSLAKVERKVEKRLQQEKTVGFALGKLWGARARTDRNTGGVFVEEKTILDPFAVDMRDPSRVIELDSPAVRGETAYCEIDRKNEDVDCVADTSVRRFKSQEKPKARLRLPRQLDSYSTFFRTEPERAADGIISPPRLNLDVPLNPATRGDMEQVMTDINGDQLDVGLDVTRPQQ